MIEHDDFDDVSSSIIIGLCAAALSGAFVGMVAGAIGATMAFVMWSAS